MQRSKGGFDEERICKKRVENNEERMAYRQKMKARIAARQLGRFDGEQQ